MQLHRNHSANSIIVCLLVLRVNDFVYFCVLIRIYLLRLKRKHSENKSMKLTNLPTSSCTPCLSSIKYNLVAAHFLRRHTMSSCFRILRPFVKLTRERESFLRHWHRVSARLQTHITAANDFRGGAAATNPLSS